MTADFKGSFRESIDTLAASKMSLNPRALLYQANFARHLASIRGRKGFRLLPLRWDDRLEVAAAFHAVDMHERNFFAHQSPEGDGPGDRARAVGYVQGWIAENNARGADRAGEVHDAWVNSPEHYANIIDPKYKVFAAARSGIYWVEMFGSEVMAKEATWTLP
ncbi:CAP domain-containing protein [Micromonospora sp. Llam7]|uniref:CAP domain-containing protein n=1 Tax=Micromonospora tarapacensis TaxID=2835305 RepID=UPI001C82B0CA|nr:CAP domain-containing protein [Micromonospora tarapacensis]MBX7265549.1 CAP domain-containing protein [Micromonospora tarapacensis]